MVFYIIFSNFSATEVWNSAEKIAVIPEFHIYFISNKTIQKVAVKKALKQAQLIRYYIIRNKQEGIK